MGKERDIKGIIECQNIIHQILSLASKDLTLQEVLERIMDILMTIPWLPFTKKGAIFLKNGSGNELKMVAVRDLPDFVVNRCRSIKLGECLCGIAALNKDIVFVNHVDEKHTIKFEGMIDHGHYCIPLLTEGEVIGVINLYLESGHRYDPVEESFLRAIGSAISDVLSYVSLKEKEKKLSQAIEQVPDWVVMTDRDGRIEYVNPAVEEITGYSREELLGKTPRVWKSGLHPREFFEELWETLLSGRSFRATFVNRKKNGELFYLDQTITPIKNPCGQIVGFIATGKDVTEQRAYQEKIYQLAYVDSVTGLPNRNLFIEKGSKMLNGDGIVLMIIDIDQFKFINDVYGSSVGNRVLKEVADRILRALPKGSLLARLGNDEFGVLIPNVSSEKRASVFARRVLKAISEPFRVSRRKITITASAGVALYPLHGRTLSELMKSADVALGLSKEEGKNRFSMFDANMTRKIREIVKLTGDLARVEVEKSFQLRYQPIVESSSGKIVSLEALLRWKGRRLSPEKFISVLEETGAINEVSLWIIEEVLEFLEKLDGVCEDKVKVSVNISPLNLMNSKFVNRAIGLLKDSGVSPERITFEITENVLIKNEDFVRENIGRLKDAGVSFAMDDFGSGYTSLKYIFRYPIDIVKPDKLFLSEVESDSKSRSLVENLVYTLKGMGMETVAEGVEREDQFELTRNLGFDLCQGFYFYKPMSEKSVLKSLCGEA